jgi:hypothetical protein
MLRVNILYDWRDFRFLKRGVIVRTYGPKLILVTSHNTGAADHHHLAGCELLALSE